MGYMDTSGSIAGISGRPFNVLLAAIVCPAIASLFVIARWFVRLRITKAVRFDDYLATLTLASNIAYGVLLGLACRPEIGVGLHIDQFPETEESNYYKWVYIYDTFYITSLLGYKTTILCLYLRVFGIRKEFKYLCWFTLFVVDGYLIGSFVVQLMSCVPPHKFWNETVAGWCVDDLRFDIAYGCLNVITDFMIATLPLREIWRLFMPVKEKIWATLIFSSAFLAFGAAIVSQTYRFHDLFSEDRTWDAAITFIWQTIEVNTGLICSCTPTLRPLYRTAAATLTRTFSSGDSDDSKGALVRGNIQEELDGIDVGGKPRKGSQAWEVYNKRKGNGPLNPINPGGPMTAGEYMIAEKLGPSDSNDTKQASDDSTTDTPKRSESHRHKNNSFERDLEFGIGLSEEERRERLGSHADASGWDGNRNLRSAMSGDTVTGEEAGGVRTFSAEHQEGLPAAVPREGTTSRQRWLNEGARQVRGNADSLVLNNEAREALERRLASGTSSNEDSLMLNDEAREELDRQLAEGKGLAV